MYLEMKPADSKGHCDQIGLYSRQKSLHPLNPRTATSERDYQGYPPTHTSGKARTCTPFSEASLMSLTALLTAPSRSRYTGSA